MRIEGIMIRFFMLLSIISCVKYNPKIFPNLKTFLNKKIVIKKDYVRVGVIDFGITKKQIKADLCGMIYDLSSQDTDLTHGNEVSNHINKNINSDNYCQFLIQVDSVDSYINALAIMAEQDIDILNLSLNGAVHDKEESLLIEEILKKGVIIVAASGNDSLNLDIYPMYPASLFSDLIVAGYNSPRTNYGSVVDVYTDDEKGSSMAAASVTAGLVNKMLGVEK